MAKETMIVMTSFLEVKKKIYIVKIENKMMDTSIPLNPSI